MTQTLCLHYTFCHHTVTINRAVHWWTGRVAQQWSQQIEFLSFSFLSEDRRRYTLWNVILFIIKMTDKVQETNFTDFKELVTTGRHVLVGHLFHNISSSLFHFTLWGRAISHLADHYSLESNRISQWTLNI
jgi:hypothetical protein